MKYLISVLAIFLSHSVLAHQDHRHPELAGHLKFKNDSLHVHATFQSPPIVGKETILILETKMASTHQNIDIDDNVEVVLWMPSMNHGSAPTQVERAVDAQGDILPGVYLVRNLYFIMGGDWEVRIILTDSLGRSETKSFYLMLEGGGHGGHH